MAIGTLLICGLVTLLVMDTFNLVLTVKTYYDCKKDGE